MKSNLELALELNFLILLINSNSNQHMINATIKEFQEIKELNDQQI